MKKLIGFLAAVALVFTVAAPASANLDSFLAGITMTKDDTLILTSEYGRDGNHSQLSIQPVGLDENGKRGQWIHCKGMSDSRCTSAAARKELLSWSNIMDCSATSEDSCIESFKFGIVGEPMVSANYVSEALSGTEFEAEPKYALLAGHGLPLYENQTSVSVSRTTKFAVMVRPMARWNQATSRLKIDRMEVKVIPYELQPRGKLSLGCAFTIGDQCAQIVDFDENTRVELAFRIPNELGGWFSGRLKAPNISVTKFNAKTNRIVISAEPVEVAAMGLVKKNSDFTDEENRWNEGHGRWSTGMGWATGANPWQEDVFPFIEHYRKQVNDISIGTNRVWNFASMAAGVGSPCIQDTSKVQGIVTSNALGYASESPSFKNGYLDYKVTGLHYLPGGQDLVLGSYDLVMRSETARCLYGFGKTPLYATVSVLNDKGTKSTASTVVSEKNGWLKMAAYGFTFSKKTIKVKITKKKK